MTKNRNETERDTKKSQVITCRLPYDQYDDYERRCIELQIKMSDLLRAAVQKFLQDNKSRN